MDSSVLVIAVRGWTTTGEALLFGRPGGEIREDFIRTLQRALGAAEIWAPELDMDMFSTRSADSLAEELFGAIDRHISARPHVKRIVLLAYSAGTLLARRVFCRAHGADNEGVVHGACAWAHKIDRLVMLSGITRGWEYSSASPAHVRFLSPILLHVARVAAWFKPAKAGAETSSMPFIWQLRRGSPFVVTTRIQYINVMEKLRNAAELPASPLRAAGLPTTIFLLGAQDQFISPADCTEMGPREEFAFVELSSSDHAAAMQICGDTPVEQLRRDRLVAALQADFAPLLEQQWAIPSADIDDYTDPMDVSGPSTIGPQGGAVVDQAVMIVHGIRDNGFWTKRVAREIKTLGREEGISVRAPTPTYGYFSMWDFIKPGGREKAAYWFLERYADVKTHFPKAAISFVGHSNGTYIAARALQICPAVKFENVVFAGSVVRRDFPWFDHHTQVKAVLNYVGAADLVVACLPGVLERLRLRWFNVGGAGAFGFHLADPGRYTAQQRIAMKEYRFIPGSHGAAIAEQFWPEIARFALLGQYPPDRVPVQRPPRIRLLLEHSPPVVLLLAMFLLLLLVSPWLVGGGLIMWLARENFETSVQLGWGMLIFTSSFALSWVLARIVRTW